LKILVALDGADASMSVKTAPPRAIVMLLLNIVPPQSVNVAKPFLPVPRIIGKAFDRGRDYNGPSWRAHSIS
jgi:hypothetical protein